MACNTHNTHRTCNTQHTHITHNMKPKRAPPKRPCVICNKHIFRLKRHLLETRADHPDIAKAKYFSPTKLTRYIGELRRNGMNSHNEGDVKKQIIDKDYIPDLSVTKRGKW